MTLNRLFSFLFIAALASAACFAQALFDKPVKVFGDPNFIGTAAAPLTYDSTGPNWVEGRELQAPQGIAIDNSVSPPNIYIADTANNRILGFHYGTQLTAGATADLVLGQTDRFSNLAQGPGTARTTGLNSPTGIAVDAAGNLYVADTGNNRILRYPKPFSQPAGYQFPDLVIGQLTFASNTGNSGGISAFSLLLNSGSYIGRNGLAFDPNGNLWVSDTGNNRVLRYNVSSLNPNPGGIPADVVLGQATFATSKQLASATAANGFYRPTGLAFDAAGNLYVCDEASRILVFAPSAATGASAIRIGGLDAQAGSPASTAIGLNVPEGIAATANNLLVADSNNNRVMVFPLVAAWPAVQTQFSPSATAVIGQSNYTNNKVNGANPEPSASTLSNPVDVAVSQNEAFVADSGNNRVLAFPVSGGNPSAQASRVIGQLDFPFYAPNLVEGKEFHTVSAFSGSAILDSSASPPHLYVADTANNRVLGFKDFVHYQNGQPADLVIGQPDLHRILVNYPSNNPNTPTAEGLNAPTGLAVDAAGNLYVTDSGNGRVLRFPAPFSSGSTNLEAADMVIGQQNFTSRITDASAITMNTPVSVALTSGAFKGSGSGFLVVSDAALNRVLLFPQPFSSGMGAQFVLGQSSFTSSASATTVNGLNSPRAVAVDPSDRILVADNGNNRIQIYDVVSALQNGAQPVVSLTNNVSSPDGIAVESDGGMWIANANSNALLHFASVNNLLTANYTADASLPAVGARSVSADAYGNLLVADGINRILYFAPQLTVVNAANYIQRPLAAGTIAAIFPNITTNAVAAGTGSFNTLPNPLPLPQTLADTQVLVNGAPTGLFYVSPGQINFPLSYRLATGGAIDVQVVRQSTGQIYGGAEVALAAASPGLFTADASGTGQIAAVNAQDSTVNSPTHPVTRGQYISLFGTGAGPVPNSPADGTASNQPLPAALNPQVVIGTSFVDAGAIEYSGLAPGYVGLWQINVQIPSNAPTGNAVPISVIQNSIPSTNPANLTQIETTIAIK